jgi:hypothetical protein
MDKPRNIPDCAPVDLIYDKDFIVVYPALDEASCRSVIERFDADKNKWRGKVGGAGNAVRKDEAKVSWDLEILNEGAWQDIFQKIHPRIQSCVAHYLSRSPILRSLKLQATGYKIQMYPENEGYFRWHADSIGVNTEDRVMAMILYLNTVAKGGETEFFHQGIKIAPKAGHLVLFPAGWNYMHCGHTPESGDKYIISTFIKLKR